MYIHWQRSGEKEAGAVTRYEYYLLHHITFDADTDSFRAPKTKELEREVIESAVALRRAELAAELRHTSRLVDNARADWRLAVDRLTEEREKQ